MEAVRPGWIAIPMLEELVSQSTKSCDMPGGIPIPVHEIVDPFVLS